MRSHPWWWAAGVLVVAGAAGATIWEHERAKAAADRAARAAANARIPVAAVAAKTGDMPVYLDSLGTVTALNTVTVHSRVDGQITSIAFHEGQFVRAGEVLAQIDSRPFEAVLANAQGQLAKDEAQLRNAQVDLQRYQVLFSQDSIPKQQLDTQAATVHQFEGVLESDRAQIDSARLNVTYARVTAPISGRIGLRLVDNGNVVHASDPTGIAVITQVQPIAIVFAIPEDNLPQVLPKLRAGQPLDVSIYGRDPAVKKLLAKGVVVTADNEIGPGTGTVKLKAQSANTDEALFPNQFVNVRLLVDTIQHAVLVPSAAIQSGPRGAFVFVVKPDNTVETRNVTVRHAEGDVSAVNGLTAGDMVVTDGIDKLQSGSKVTVQSGGASNSVP